MTVLTRRAASALTRQSQERGYEAGGFEFVGQPREYARPGQGAAVRK